MTPPTPTPPPGKPSKKDLDNIFGDVLPSTTSDERDDQAPRESPDDWYERNRPPHHDSE
jgi:hypothetical protein